MKLSARNKLQGTVVGGDKGSVNARVKIDVGGGTIITSMITNAAVEELGLFEGQEAYAVTKASRVMVAADD